MSPGNHPSLLQLYGYLAREPGSERVAPHLDICVRCCALVAELRRDPAASPARPPTQEALARRAGPDALTRRPIPGAVARRPTPDAVPRRPIPDGVAGPKGQRPKARRSWSQRTGLSLVWPGVAVALTAAAVLVLAMLPAGVASGPVPHSADTSMVEIAVGRGDESFDYRDQPLLPGDRVAFRYTTGERYLLLASVEDSGRTSILLPAGGTSSIPIEPGVRVRLEQQVVIDHPSAERWVMVLSHEPIPTAKILQALEAAYADLDAEERYDLELGPLDLPGDVHTWLLTKQTR